MFHINKGIQGINKNTLNSTLLFTAQQKNQRGYSTPTYRYTRHVVCARYEACTPIYLTRGLFHNTVVQYAYVNEERYNRRNKMRQTTICARHATYMVLVSRALSGAAKVLQ